jgi:hypothetical protein
VSRRTVYVVSRRSVREEEGRWAQLCDEPNRASGLSWVPLRAFADRDEAEACRRELERSTRVGLCPFALNADVRNLTSLDGDPLRERLFELGLMPPLEGWYVDVDWIGWWREVAPGLTEEQLHGVWDLLDRARLHAVVALEMEG